MFLAFNVLSKLGAADTALKAAKRIQASAPTAKMFADRVESKKLGSGSPNNCPEVSKNLKVIYEFINNKLPITKFKWFLLIIFLIYFILALIVNSPLMDYLSTPTVDTGLEFIGDGWWDVDFIREDGLRSCEERFANSNCLYGNDLSLWMSGGNGEAGKEEGINKNDNDNNLEKCSQGQIYQWDWWWAVDKDERGPGNNYQYYCGDLDELDKFGSERYCKGVSSNLYILNLIYETNNKIKEVFSRYLLEPESMSKTNAPRKYLECLYLNKKKCEPESGIRLPFVNLNESVTALGSSIADGFWGGLQAIGIVDDPPDNNATRMNRCMVQAGGINYRDTTKQAKNSIRYRIYKEKDDESVLQQMEGPSECKQKETLEEEINSPSKDVCFGNFKPNCGVPSCNQSISDQEGWVRMFESAGWFCLGVIAFLVTLVIIELLLSVYLKIIEINLPSYFKCDK